MTSHRDIPTAPDPAPRRGEALPEDPRELTKPSWTYILRKTRREFLYDECVDQAAALTYYSVLALFPSLLAIVSLIGLVGRGPDGVDAMLGVVEDLGQQQLVASVRPVLEQLGQSPASGLTFVVGLLGALWTASAYVGAFGRAMNRVYRVEEGRPVWKLRPYVLVLTLLFVVLVALVVLTLVLSGPVAVALGDALGLGSATLTVWSVVKWPFLLAVVAFVVALLYYSTPNVKQPRFRWISIGAVVAIAIWALASAGFALYVANFARYESTYGSLGGVIVFLIWLWLTNLALLFGAELDAEIERGRELQAGMPAEEGVRLPPRDTRRIDTMAERRAEDVRRSRLLRESRGRTESEQATGRSAPDDTPRPKENQP